MDRSLLQDRIDSNQPFTIETASGRQFHVPGQDFIHFSPSKTAVVIFWTEDDGDHMADVPLLTITSVSAKISNN